MDQIFAQKHPIANFPKLLIFMAEKINIFWFRQDLRIADNPALTHAAESGRVLAVYILDQNDQGDHGPGAASRWWLHHSLNALNESLQGHLNIFWGDPKTILQNLQEKYGSTLQVLLIIAYANSEGNAGR